MIPGAFPIVGGVKKPPVLTYRDIQGDSSAHTGAHTYTCAFGPADPNRYILIGAALLGSPVMTIVSIGGVAPTLLVSRIDLSTEQAAWYIAKVPTGTSGSVVTSSPGGSTNWIGGVVCYSLIATNLITTDTNSTISTPGPMPVSVTGGGVVACMYNGYGTHSTWSGGVTLDAAGVGSVTIGSASTHSNVASSQTLTPTITAPSGGAPGSAVAVAFR